MREKLLKIMNYFDIENQQRKLAEEVWELNDAITRSEIANDYEENRKKYLDHIKEEIADCFVILFGIKEFYNFSNEEIRDLMNYKINRTLNRIDDRYYLSRDELLDKINELEEEKNALEEKYERLKEIVNEYYQERSLNDLYGISDRDFF